jgi:hypothetical protein
MRKLIILFILLLPATLWATGNKITIDGVANVVSINGSTFTAVDGVTGTASSSGTWYKNVHYDASHALGNDSATYSLGSRVQIGSGTNITKIAFKVRNQGSATNMKLGLFQDTATSAALYANGTCTPADATWCVASVTYTGSANAYYVVMGQSDVTTTQYGVESGTPEGILYNGTYSSFPANPTTFYIYKWASYEWDVAICAGGTCSGTPD